LLTNKRAVGATTRRAHNLLAIGRLLAIVAVVVGISIVAIGFAYASNTVTEIEQVAYGGTDIGHYTVIGTCTYGPSISQNISTYTTFQSANGFGLHTTTATDTLDGGIVSIGTTTTVTNTTLASSC
jgi:hypothetical protein